MPTDLQYCLHPKVIVQGSDQVSGKTFASIARGYGPCGKTGKYWNAKAEGPYNEKETP